MNACRVIAIYLLTVGPASAQEIVGTVAIVNGEAIPRADLDTLLARRGWTIRQAGTDQKAMERLPDHERNYFRLMSLDSNIVQSRPGKNDVNGGGGEVWK